MFASPHIEYGDLWPLLVVFGAACAGVLVEAFVPRSRRFALQAALTGAALLVGLIGTIEVGLTLPDLGGAHGLVAGVGSLVLDGPTVLLQGLILVCAIAGTVLFAERKLTGGVSAFAGQAAALPGSGAERRAADLEHTEVFPLLLFAVGGMMLFPAANDLLMAFVALEVLSLPLYLLTGVARHRRLISQEAALKYFLLGAFSSAFFLYGLALVYGATGTTTYAQVWQVGGSLKGTDEEILLVAGIALIAVGLLFKVGAVPFQAWTPDVYQGAPTPVTAFMAAGTKIAAFGALTRILYVAFGAQLDAWRPMITAVAIATMLLGATVAMLQTDMKRFVGYSAIAHSGFLMAGLVGLTSRESAVMLSSTQAIVFYLVAYSAAVMGAVALTGVVRTSHGEASHLDAWSGLGRRHPWVGAGMTIVMLSLAGIPPTAGFIAKWSVLAAAADAGLWSVVGVGIAASLIAIVSYIRVILVMFFREPSDATATVVRPSWPSIIVIGACCALTVILGVVPGPLLDLIVSGGSFIG